MARSRVLACPKSYSVVLGSRSGPFNRTAQLFGTDSHLGNGFPPGDRITSVSLHSCHLPAVNKLHRRLMRRTD